MLIDKKFKDKSTTNCRKLYFPHGSQSYKSMLKDFRKSFVKSIPFGRNYRTLILQVKTIQDFTSVQHQRSTKKKKTQKNKKMTFKSVAFKCALLVAMAFAGDASARPEGTPTTAAAVQQSTTTAVAEVQHQMVATPKETQAPYNAAARNSHKEHYQHQQHHHHHQLGGKLSIVRLVLIIGKVIAPLIGAILEPLLINIVKGITWAITYSLATGFDKPPSYEHFVPALHHHGGGGDDEYDEGDGHHEYESHKPVTYSLNDLPGMALQLTSTVISESGNQPEQSEAAENAEKKLKGPLSTSKPSPVQ